MLQVFNAYFSVILELSYLCVKLYLAGYELEALARGLGGGEAFSLNTIHEQPPKSSYLNSVETVITSFNIFSSIGVRLFRKVFMTHTQTFFKKLFRSNNTISRKTIFENEHDRIVYLLMDAAYKA